MNLATSTDCSCTVYVHDCKARPKIRAYIGRDRAEEVLQVAARAVVARGRVGHGGGNSQRRVGPGEGASPFKGGSECGVVCVRSPHNPA